MTIAKRFAPLLVGLLSLAILAAILGGAKAATSTHTIVIYRHYGPVLDSNPRIFHLNPRDEDPERYERWMQRCQVQFRFDAFGVSRAYHNEKPGCGFGQDRD